MVVQAENLIVKGVERIAYAYVDPRAYWTSSPPVYRTKRDYWPLIWMAVSCCCGWTGPAERVDLPPPRRYW